jgi:hypothetical protein
MTNKFTMLFLVVLSRSGKGLPQRLTGPGETGNVRTKKQEAL